MVRHGELETGAEKRYIGWLDLPLSATGRLQAARLREFMAKIPLEAVYCSDLIRSHTTAQIICEKKGLKPHILTELREINLGEWEGKTFTEIKRNFPAAFNKRGDDIANFQPPGGESFAQCSARAVSALGNILQNSSGNILIVGHAGTNRAIICHLLGIPLENLFKIRQDYGCINEFIVSCTHINLRSLNCFPFPLKGERKEINQPEMKDSWLGG